MVSHEKLYDAFGELIYAVAKADGEVQEVEITALNNLTKNFAGKYNIDFSFNYNLSKNKSVETAFKDAVQVCKANGPDPEYTLLLNIMVEVAKAFMGIVPNEKIILDNFVDELRTKFINEMTNN